MKIQKQREVALRKNERTAFKLHAYNLRLVLKHYAEGRDSCLLILDDAEVRNIHVLMKALNYLLPNGVRAVDFHGHHRVENDKYRNISIDFHTDVENEIECNTPNYCSALGYCNCDY